MLMSRESCCGFLKKDINLFWIFLFMFSQSHLVHAKRYEITHSKGENIRAGGENDSSFLNLAAFLPKGTILEISDDEVRKAEEELRSNPEKANREYNLIDGSVHRSKNGWIQNVKIVSVPDSYKDSIDIDYINEKTLWFSLSSFKFKTQAKNESSNNEVKDQRETTRVTWAFENLFHKSKAFQEVKKTLEPSYRTVVDAVSGVKDVISGYIASPVAGLSLCSLPVNSHFGRRQLAGEKSPRNHDGMDIAASEGDIIQSVFSGVVTEVGFEEHGYGNYIEVDHPRLGFRTRYAHLSEKNVKKGDAVKAGQQIGLAGQTGHATGPHLHLEVLTYQKKNGKITLAKEDPRDYLNMYAREFEAV